MNDLPLVSIGIPAYNHERYVQECIQSIIDQDYPRIELIVIDDGSKDKTWDKIQEMRPACERRFERLVMETQPNQGTAVTCSRIELLQSGEFIGIIASDDKYLPGAISKLVKPLMEDPNIGYSVGVNIIVDSDGKRCYWDAQRNNVYDESLAKWKTFDEFTSDYSKVDFNGPDFGSYETLARGNYIPNGGLHRRIINGRSIERNPKALLEDWWFNLQMSKVAKYRHVDEPTFCYRWHGGNTAGDSPEQRQNMARMSMATKMCERQLLKDTNDVKHAKIFREYFPFERTICCLALGGHNPGLYMSVDFDVKQVFFRCSKFILPLTPKMRW